METFNIMEWLNFSLLTLLAIASPGPSFLISLRNTLTYGKMGGFMTALGIALGDMIHALFSLLGLSLIITKIPHFFIGIKILGAIYLIYLGFKSLSSKKIEFNQTDATLKNHHNYKKNCFLKGLFVILLNPQAWIFFICLASTLISPCTPIPVRFFYSFWVAILSIFWFSIVAIFFGKHSIRTKFVPYLHWINRFMGLALIYWAFILCFSLQNLH